MEWKTQGAATADIGDHLWHHMGIPDTHGPLDSSLLVSIMIIHNYVYAVYYHSKYMYMNIHYTAP